MARRTSRLPGSAIACVLTSLLLSSCQNDEIRRYEVPKEPQADQLSYTTPAGWIDVPVKKTVPVKDRSLRTEAAFQVTEGVQTANTTVSVIPDERGGLLSNVNRWREQVGLDLFTEEQMRKEGRAVDVAGSPAWYVDLTGPEAAGPKRQRLLGVIQTRGRETWFYKMIGPTDLVAKQRAAFDAFLQSVRFDGSTGANP